MGKIIYMDVFNLFFFLFPMVIIRHSENTGREFCSLGTRGYFDKYMLNRKIARKFRIEFYIRYLI